MEVPEISATVGRESSCYSFLGEMVESKDVASEECKEKDNAAYLKRREQVRRAQRTHRERKEAYIKSLENEIQQQRYNESKTYQEKRHLQTEVGRLRGILEQHGIAHDSSLKDVSAAWGMSNTSVAPRKATIRNYSDAHQPRSPFSGQPIATANELYSSESDRFPDLENATSPLRDITLFQGQEDSDIDSGGTGSPPGNPPLASDISAISTYASHLNLDDMDMTVYRANLTPQSETRSPIPMQSGYYQMPFSQSPAAHTGASSTSPLFQQYISHPINPNNALPSHNWPLSSAAPENYSEGTSLLSTTYQVPHRAEYRNSDAGSSGDGAEEIYRRMNRPNYQNWRSSSFGNEFG